ncbi:L,D-transpeptidase family protein [Sphingomonas piscis]|uniref:L,D-transpeptidase family protein n=1 Tax=Sphingomonas piscis TaxID=2714943 RepID=A0A6G7YRM2_9SPHN|nr:L,D-transpeptidase family protein [Sphingomonas piscis]QIK79386.1 L,D-transpeptidase family protein [Sphingomonas piscis]
MKHLATLFTGAALTVALPLAAQAQVQPLIAGSFADAGGLAAQNAVAAFYKSYSVPPIWFRGGVASPALADVQRVLYRAPFDGFAAGPQYAAQIQAAIRQAASGNKADITAAERAVSTAWVAYVQSLKQLTPGMIYAYPVLAPQGTRADQILLTAAAAPSLQAYVNSTSNLNPVYAQLRDAAWLQGQSAGNMTPDPRLLANLERVRSLPSAGKFIFVDAGSQMLYMYENGRVVDSMKVVVGDKKNFGLPTPMIASIMHYMTFNPYWNVPHHLVRQKVAPGYLKEGAKYLKARGYEIVADWSEDAAVISPDTVDWKAVAAGAKQIRVRQLPGPTNSMGKMKFPFPNGQDIFLHDTPQRDYFNLARRDRSNGCVRLEAAPRLARWLLGQDAVAPSKDPEIRTKLPAGIPVYLSYLTAKPTSTGIAYLDDIYGWDVPGAQVAAVSAPVPTATR